MWISTFTTVGQIVSVGIGVIAGVCVSTGYLLRRRRARSIYCCVTYENLIEFSKTCKRTFPQIVKCRVVCELLEEGVYRVTQIMLDDRCGAVRSKTDIVGRIIKCRSVDDKILALCGTHIPGEFDFVV